ncbi:MAG: hypothetical protein JXB07_15320, partial [Anaerolineae bacterium]|nr:hypothetical protein [Anaerolineae bacterium]
MGLPHDNSENETPNQPSEDGGGSLPDWLSSETEPGSPSPTSGTPQPADLPDWLREAAGSDEAVTSTPATADVPDWLQSVAEPALPDEPPSTSEPAAPSPIDMPDWLTEAAAGPTDEAAEAPSMPEPAAPS